MHTSVGGSEFWENTLIFVHKTKDVYLLLYSIYTKLESINAYYQLCQWQTLWLKRAYCRSSMWWILWQLARRKNNITTKDTELGGDETHVK
jgi:hypothetical protein